MVPASVGEAWAMETSYMQCRSTGPFLEFYFVSHSLFTTATSTVIGLYALSLWSPASMSCDGRHSF